MSDMTAKLINCDAVTKLINHCRTTAELLETSRNERSAIASVTATHMYGTPASLHFVRIRGALPSSAMP